MQPTDSKEFLQYLHWRTKVHERSLEVTDCIAIWSDICGFGSKLELSNWDLKQLQNLGIIELLHTVHTFLAMPILPNVSPSPHDKVLVLNDGIARTVDLKNKHLINGHNFLRFFRDLLIGHFQLLNITDKYKLGIRTVLAGGERVQYAQNFITGNSILAYNDSGATDWGKQLLETTFTYNPSEFQMNTAFAKAYTIESLGTKKEIHINGLFLERSFLEKIKGVQDITLKLDKNNIKIYLNNIIMFNLSIYKELELSIKGLITTVYHIDELFIHKEFDGDDVEFPLFNLQED